MSAIAGNVTHLRHLERDVYLVGTAHISRHSVAEVRQVIHDLRPDTVCVELDETRYGQLMNDLRYQQLDVRQLLHAGRVYSTLLSLTLAAFQRRLGNRLGVKPGAELLAGVEAAREVGAEVVLADRDVQITLKRCWANLSLLDKAQLLIVLVVAFFGRSDLTEQQVEDLKNRETIGDTMSEFANHLPRLQLPLIDERDRYLVDAIHRCGGTRIVAVVGAGHVAGMKRYLGTTIAREELVAIPVPRRSARLWPWLVPALAVSAFGLALLNHGLSLAPRLLQVWCTATLVGCGLALVIARPAPVTWLTTTLLAPITALAPWAASGNFAGRLQAKLHPATDADRSRLVDSMLSFRTQIENRFLHALVVYACAQAGTQVGAVLGTLLALRAAL